VTRINKRAQSVTCAGTCVSTTGAGDTGLETLGSRVRPAGIRSATARWHRVNFGDGGVIFVDSHSTSCVSNNSRAFRLSPLFSCCSVHQASAGRHERRGCKQRVGLRCCGRIGRTGRAVAGATDRPRFVLVGGPHRGNDLFESYKRPDTPTSGLTSLVCLPNLQKNLQCRGTMYHMILSVARTVAS